LVPLLFSTNPVGAVPLNVKLTSGFKITPLRVSLFNTDVVVPPIPPVYGTAVKSSTMASTAA
jgi:hypothetical protein